MPKQKRKSGYYWAVMEPYLKNELAFYNQEISLWKAIGIHSYLSDKSFYYISNPNKKPI